MNDNKLSGVIGQDPELITPNGSEYALLKFSIANNDERRKNKNGEYENITSWFDIEFWTKNPQHWLKQLYKGTPVLIPAEAKQQTWEKDGQKRSKVIFKVLQGQFPLLLAKKESQQQPSNPQPFPNEPDKSNDWPAF